MSKGGATWCGGGSSGGGQEDRLPPAWIWQTASRSATDPAARSPVQLLRNLARSRPIVQHRSRKLEAALCNTSQVVRRHVREKGWRRLADAGLGAVQDPAQGLRKVLRVSTHEGERLRHEICAQKGRSERKGLEATAPAGRAQAPRS